MAGQIAVVRCGRTTYDACTALQFRLAGQRMRGECGDTLLITEHEHVYTIGTGGSDDHLLARPDELQTLGAVVRPTNRGGDITYHGPGQLVVYPLLDLHSYTCDLHWYLRTLEEVVIQTLAIYDIAGERLEGSTGVWTRGEKICAIGIHAKHWVTMHGFALNVSTDMSYFSRIIPCGIFDRGVTSMQDVIGVPVAMADVEDQIIGMFGQVFGATMIPTQRHTILADSVDVSE